MIILIHESKYCIVHQNLYSLISINIGGSHFGHSFVSLACPLFGTSKFSYILEIIIFWGHSLKILNTCDTPFCELTYFVSFFDGQFSKCDILLVSNVSVFKCLSG